MKMPTEKIDTAMFAPCGMNCLVCYKHCYHNNSDYLQKARKYGHFTGYKN